MLTLLAVVVFQGNGCFATYCEVGTFLKAELHMSVPFHPPYGKVENDAIAQGNIYMYVLHDQCVLMHLLYLKLQPVHVCI